MILSDEILMRVAIGLLGVCGFLVARLINNHKVKNKPLVCPVGFDCHAVVHSGYSKFLNIPLETLGMAYYLFIAFSYFLSIFFSSMLPDIFVALVAISSFGAFLFSLYLIGVQLFVLKKGCSWCFVSAFISVAIFVLTARSYGFSFVESILLK